LLIMPDAHMHKLHVGPFVRSMREMPLTLCTLAALALKRSDCSVRLVDGSVEPVPLDAEADLVGISAITGCANSAYKIAGHYRERGIPVVLGGVHVTILPGEALRHADSIVIGRGETAWPRLLDDFARGQMQRIYREEMSSGDSLPGVPVPRWDLHKRHRYMLPYSIQATRGCRRACDFCTVHAVWPRFLKRPVAEVVRDIRATRSRYIAFNDVSLLDDPEYAKELLTAMIPLKKRWGGLATVDILRDPELLALLPKSGCAYLLFGFESNVPTVLTQINKGFNKPANYGELMRVMHTLGVSVQGCFVFGFDDDDPSVFDATIERVQELKVDIPRYSIYTPYPGTALFQRLLAEGRILSFNWEDYDTMHVVFRPAKMSPQELYAGFKRAYAETFSLRRIFNRMHGADLNTLINFVGNLSYRLFVRRLRHESRFAFPYSIQAPGRPPAASDFSLANEDVELCTV